MQLWEQILARIQEKVSVQNFQIWFKPTSLDHQDVNKKQLFVWVPNKHFKYWLTENYADVLDEVLRELDMDSFEIHFKVAEEDGLAEGLDRKGIVKAGMKFDYRVFSEDEDKILGKGYTKHACVDRNGQLVRPPELIKKLIEDNSRKGKP